MGAPPGSLKFPGVGLPTIGRSCGTTSVIRFVLEPGSGMREVRFAVDSPLEEEGYEPSVPVEDGSFSSPRSSVQGPALPRERSSIPQKRRGHSGVRYMGFAALNPAASRALAIGARR